MRSETIKDFSSKPFVGLQTAMALKGRGANDLEFLDSHTAANRACGWPCCLYLWYASEQPLHLHLTSKKKKKSPYVTSVISFSHLFAMPITKLCQLIMSVAVNNFSV